MLSKAVYQQLDTNYIMKDVYDWLYEEDSGILAAMPSVTVQGNGIKYNVETTDPLGAWVDTGDVIPENAGTFTQRSAAIYQLIGDIDVDKFVIATNSTQNPELVEIKRKTRALMRQWQEALIWGQTTTSSSTKQPKGLVRLLVELESEATVDLDGVVNSQVIANHATSGTITLDNLERTMDQVKLGCNAIVLSRVARRAINTLCRAAGILFQSEKDAFNHNIESYNGAKFYLNDHMDNNIPDNNGSSVLTIASHAHATTWASDYDNTMVLCMRLAEDGVCQIMAPGGSLHKEKPFTPDNKNAWRHRFIAYPGFACYNKFALAGLTGVVTLSNT
uniref:Putative capsid protein n=1 Tax=viral metagenome TaxID=1070528 RepID=A0A6M3KKR0_9ZZZZ